jgi:hypothetical protein
VTRILWCGCFTGAENHSILSAQYGDSVLPQRSVVEWIYMLKCGRRRVTDEERSGALSHRRMKATLKKLQISYGSVYEIIHDRLHFHNVFIRWILRYLSEERGCNCLETRNSHLSRYREKSDAFLHLIVTGDGRGSTVLNRRANTRF